MTARLLLMTWLAAVLLVPSAAAAERKRDPRLAVPRAELEAGLDCPAEFAHPERNPMLLVHGTTTNAKDTWSWNWQRALPGLGYDVCVVNLPDESLGDIQISSEYVVFAIRRMHRRSGRRVNVMGHSQGALQPRWAMRWWAEPRRLRR